MTSTTQNAVQSSADTMDMVQMWRLRCLWLSVEVT